MLNNDSGKTLAVYEMPQLSDSSPPKSFVTNDFLSPDLNPCLLSGEKDIFYQIDRQENILTIKTLVDVEWLNSSERLFPVFVDPTISATAPFQNDYIYSFDTPWFDNYLTVTTAGAPVSSEITNVNLNIFNSQFQNCPGFSLGCYFGNNYVDFNGDCGTDYTWRLGADGIYQEDACGGDYSTWNGRNPNNTWTLQLNSADGGIYRARFGFTVEITYLALDPGSWTGLISSDWGDRRNWISEIVPDKNTDVEIPSGTPNDPVIEGFLDAECKNIIIEEGATLTLKMREYWIWAGSFSIYGDVQVNGEINDQTSILTSFYGSDNNIITPGDTDNWGVIIVDNAGYEFIGPASFNELLIRSGGSLTLNDKHVRINAIVQLGNLNLSSGTLEIKGSDTGLIQGYYTNPVFTQEKFQAASGTVWYSRGAYDETGGQSVKSINYYNLKISTQGGQIVNIGEDNGNISCNDLFINNEGSLQGGVATIDQTIIIRGNLYLGMSGKTPAVTLVLNERILGNNSDFFMGNNTAHLVKINYAHDTYFSFAGFDSPQVFYGTVNFINSSSSRQVIMGATYYNLEINGSGIRRLGGHITINGNLLINDGTLQVSNSDLILKGNLINNSSFNSGSRKVTISGSSNSVIGGSSTVNFNNLIVEKENSSARVINSGRSFSVNGNLNLKHGELLLQAADKDYVFNNDLIVENAGTLIHDVSWDDYGKCIKIGGNMQVDGIFNPLVRSNVNMNSTNTANIQTGSNPLSTLSVLTFSNGNFTASGPLKTNQEVWAVFDTPGSFSTNGYPVEFENTVVAGGRLFVDGGSLTTASLQIGNGSSQGEVLLDSGTLNASSITVGHNSVDGKLILSAGTLNLEGNLMVYSLSEVICDGDPLINIYGNWTNNGIYRKDYETVAFKGSLLQVIENGDYSFNKVTLDNSGVGVSLKSDLKIENNLEMVRGNILCNDNFVQVGENTGIQASITHHSGRIIGEIRQWVKNDIPSGLQLNLPLGTADNNRWVRINFNIPPATPGFLQAVQTNSLGFPFDDISLGLPVVIDEQLVDNVSEESFWRILPLDAKLSGGEFDIQFNTHGISGINQPEGLRVVKRNEMPDDGWQSAGNHGGVEIIDESTGSYWIKTKELSSFAWFGLASRYSENPLPVELLSFEAGCDGQNILISWSTASETNNSHFILKKSQDGHYFYQIATINGAGFSNQIVDYLFSDFSPGSQTVYYSLEQHDFDGKTEHLGVISAFCMEDTPGLEIVKYLRKQTHHELVVHNPGRISASWQLVNSSGLTVSSGKIEPGRHTVSFPHVGMKMGVMIFLVKNSKEMVWRKILNF